MISDETALELLKIGAEYYQIVIKTEKAAKQLKWLNVITLSNEKIHEIRELVCREEEQFQEDFLNALNKL